MKKQVILSFTQILLVIAMCGVLVFALDLDIPLLPPMPNSTNVTNTTIDNSTIENSTIPPVENITIGNNTDQNSTIVPPVENETHIGSHYTNGYSTSNEQISHGGTHVQTETSSKSGYTNGHSGSSESIGHGGTTVQAETSSKSGVHKRVLIISFIF